MPLSRLLPKARIRLISRKFGLVPTFLILEGLLNRSLLTIRESKTWSNYTTISSIRRTLGSSMKNAEILWGMPYTIWKGSITMAKSFIEYFFNQILDLLQVIVCSFEEKPELNPAYHLISSSGIRTVGLKQYCSFWPQNWEYFSQGQIWRGNTEQWWDSYSLN